MSEVKLPLRSRIAVVITSYNYRDYVIEAVDSVLAQTRVAEAVVVVDDGSSDGSGELLRERYAAEPRVSLLFGPNAGQLSAATRTSMHATCSLLVTSALGGCPRITTLLPSRVSSTSIRVQASATKVASDGVSFSCSGHDLNKKAVL